MATANKREIPNFIKARNPKRLRVFMINNNIRLRSTVNYFNIQFVKNEWYAWYYEPIEKSEEIKEANGIT